MVPRDRRPPGLLTALRVALRVYGDEILVLGLANLAWLAVVVAAAALAAVVPLLIVIAPLLAIPTAALMRLAIVAARDEAPSWREARDELGRQIVRKVIVATVQIVAIGMALANISLGVATGGVLGSVIGLTGFYVLLLVPTYAVALWPIMADPVRPASLRGQLKMATALLVSRPLQLLVLAAITGLAVLLSVQLIAPSAFLPSLVMVAIATYVIPILDQSEPITTTDGG